MTLGLDFRLKTVRLNNGYTVSAQIWDTAGQERYRAIAKSFYTGAHGVLLVYDVNDFSSFTELTQIWIPELLEIVGSDIKLILVGNKCDLKFREVEAEVAQAYADERGIPFYETSALSSHNIANVCNILISLTSKPIIDKIEEEKKNSRSGGGGSGGSTIVDINDDGKPKAGFWSWLCGSW